MASFEEQIPIELDGLGNVLFCHATPNSDEEILTRATLEARLRGILSGLGQDFVVCGHVHTQYERRQREGRGTPTRTSPWVHSGRCSIPKA